MIDPKIKSAIEASLGAYAEYTNFDAVALTDTFFEVFAADEDFLTKVDLLDEVFDTNNDIEELREVYFDMLMINFFSQDVKKLEEDYLDSPEWEAIEEETLDRGTELLNLLLYLNECEDEEIEPSLDDYLKEFLLVDEDEFQDEYQIYEPVIANQILIESPVEEIARFAKQLPDDSELKDLFYPMMCFFSNSEFSEDEYENMAENAPVPEFDMAVLEILIAFN
ncbi:hypothetical protein [Mucilaginibacter sp.]